jgi:hypothetical protein
MKRREFITFVGAAAACPVVARAQPPTMPLIGVLMNRVENDPEGQARLAAFLQGLQASGWDVSRNVRVETRWGADDVGLERKYAAELIALSPDILWRPELWVSQPCRASAAPFQLYSRLSPIPSVRALSTPYPGPAEV